MRQNVKSILIRLTAEEYAHLKAISEETGLKIEPMIRQLIMGVELQPRPPDEYAALLRELSAIGNNINQIAYLGECQQRHFQSADPRCRSPRPEGIFTCKG